MKCENYLIRLNNEDFALARGYKFEEGENLAIVRLSTSPLEFKGDYSIIDIPSGLKVIREKTKKKLLEKWIYKRDYFNILEAISKAREGSKYLDRVTELNNEKKVWRTSGYEIR